jgi:hypothetical protein
MPRPLVVAVACCLLGAAGCSKPPVAPARPPEPGPDAGTVVVETQPYGMDIVADGFVRCRTPCSFRIAPGLHRLSVRRSGFMPWQEDVLVSAGQEVKVSASLVGSH